MRLFTDVMRDLRNGAAVGDLTNQLDELIERVKATGKSGEISISIKVKPASKGGDIDMVTMDDTIKLKLPQMDKGQTFFFLTEGGDPVRNNPRQPGLDLRIAEDANPAELKELG